MAKRITDAEICVIGGGIAGLVFARLVKRDVVVLDGDTNADDGKSVVVGAKTAQLLATLDALPPTSRPLCRARVSFSGGGETLLNGKDAPFAYGIDHKAAQAALRRGLQIRQTKATGIAQEEAAAVVQTANGAPIRAKHIFAACSLPFLPPPFVVRRRRYAQTVLSLAAECETFPNAAAEQRFTPWGMFVLAPRADGKVGVILSAPPANAAILNTMPDEKLSSYLSGEFGREIKISGRRAAYAPQLVRVRPFRGGNITLLGGGATLLHPAGARSTDLAAEDAQDYAKQINNHAAHIATHRRAAAHRTAIMLTDALALGAHCRALPLRLAGGALLSLFAQTPLKNAVLFAGRGAAGFGARARDMRQ